MKQVISSASHRKLIITAISLAILLGWQADSFAAKDKIKVSFLSPLLSRPFWVTTMEMMQAAAEDLGIELTVVVSEGRASYKQHKAGKAMLNAVDKPDYFITGLWLDVTDRLLKLAEKKQIKSLIFNGTLTSENQEFFGLPRGNLKHWIGHLYPDDLGGSYQLASYLQEQTRLNTSTLTPGVIEIIGLGGDPESPPSRFRTHGLRRALSETDRTHMVDFVHCDWDEKVAQQTTLELLQLHPATRTIWAASDSMAMGALSAIRVLGKKPGKDIIVGGFDWSPEALQEIKKGNLAASVGGHIAEGVWALILVHDYHYGIDFVRDPGIQHKTKMSLINSDNVEKYIKLLKDADWKQIDFRQFSKVHNKELRNYNFNFEAIAEQLTATTRPQNSQ